RTADISFFATDVGVADYLSHPDEALRPAIENRLREYASKYTVYGNIYLFDPACRLRASLQPVSGLDSETPLQGADAAFLREVLASDAAYTEHFAIHSFSRIKDRPTLVYAHRVVADGKVVGVVCLGFRMADEMPAIFASIQGNDLAHGNDVVLALTDDRGEVLASSDAHQLPPGWMTSWQLPPGQRSGAFMLQH
ncbi:cache domain-containing protein, partial [Leptospira sp. SA-E8]|uniref:cache domain-containing protein n=1 Tax=Leptospira sp. SA-E8 TaxID=3422259 RepID=UPI003EBCA723